MQGMLSLVARFFLRTVELRDNGNNSFVFSIRKVECETFRESEGRNHLAGNELPPGDTCIFVWFLGSYEEPPGGEPYAARRRILFNPGSGFPYECQAVVIDPLGDKLVCYRAGRNLPPGDSAGKNDGLVTGHEEKREKSTTRSGENSTNILWK
ncbi:hypothetical protein DEO72_LG10g1474 [Vigna unguiculata]|uniref:Uncharacterized protein n=1 Tax=Vigna unguiculata TaxID=3917 RepID=A0A4D6N939_VIGUN|nr:hypothetical protein DEO72_LG10g1474 [Vigna unguiculata]